MNTPVSFELAKLLKEKGFTSVFTAFSNKYYNSLGEYKIVSYDAKIENNEYEAPTIVEVVMWLYEKYGIWVECYIDDNGTFGYLVSMITKEGRIDFPLKREFKSPTEAYEAAIKYTLQNLLS